jgi:hypothetical protein
VMLTSEGLPIANITIKIVSKVVFSFSCLGGLELEVYRQEL